MDCKSQKNAIEINNKESKYFYQRGVLVFQAGNYEEALKDFNHTIQYKKNHLHNHSHDHLLLEYNI